MTTEKAIEYGKELLTMVSGECNQFVEKSIAALKEKQSIVHCKDCANWKETIMKDNPLNLHCCALTGGIKVGNAFCSDGERE